MKGRPLRKLKNQVEEESVNVGLQKKDAICHSKWSVGVNKIAAVLRWIWPHSLIGDQILNIGVCLSLVCLYLFYHIFFFFI